MTEKEKKLERALATIEGLCLASEDESLGTIYRIAHTSLGYCRTCKDISFIDGIVKRLKEDKIIDVDNLETNQIMNGLHRAGSERSPF